MIRQLKALWRKNRNNRKKSALDKQLKRWDKKPTEHKTFSKVQTICLLRWDNKLGDAVISSAFITCLNKYRPDLKISVITGSISASWLSNIGDVEIIECPRRSLKTAQSFIQYKGKFDVVIDLGSSFSEKELLALSVLDASYYIGYDKEKYNIFNVHIAHEYINFSLRYRAAAQLFIDEPDFEYKLPLPDYSQCTKSLQPWFDEAKKNGKYCIAMNFFGSGKYRRFSLTQALCLVDRWTENNVDDCLILIPVPNQNDFLSAIKNSCKNPARVIYIDQQSSINNTLALLTFSDYCFTPDTSVVHMASATNTPVLAIYGGCQRNYEEWKPLAQHSQVIFNPQKKNSNERISVNHFDWNELLLARVEILKGIAL